ncbi:MAG: hypothetical protein IKH95_09910 [Bacteroidaceae bacterium]|nr:hypothetical protein [Bacteroidaceae bacterium]
MIPSPTPVAAPEDHPEVDGAAVASCRSHPGALHRSGAHDPGLCRHLCPCEPRFLVGGAAALPL